MNILEYQLIKKGGEYMTQDELKKKAEALKKKYSQEVQKDTKKDVKQETSISEKANALKQKYSTTKETKKQETTPTTTTIPTFKTLEEAQQYAKENNLKTINNNVTIPSITKQETKQETEQEEPKIKMKESFAGDILDPEDLKVPEPTTNTTSDYQKAVKNNTIQDWVQDQEAYIKYLSKRDQVDYLQDFYDMFGEFGGNLKSRYLKNFTRDDLYAGGMEKARENYTKALKEQKDIASYATNFKKNIINPIGSFVLGTGEGAGGAAIAKKTMQSANEAIAHLEAIKNGGDAQTYYDTMNTLNELPSSREVLDNLYKKFGSSALNGKVDDNGEPV